MNMPDYPGVESFNLASQLWRSLRFDEQLLVEAKVKPRDVAFLVPGMSARVKITAYDYTVYG